MSVYQKQIHWLSISVVAIVLAITLAAMPVVSDNLAGTDWVSPALAGDHEEGGGG